MRRRNMLALLTLLVTACSSASGNPTGTESSPSPSTSTTSTSTITSTSTTPPPQPVTIVFAGDTNFEGTMGARLARDPSTAVGPFTGILSAADLAIGNLETALGTRGTPENKQFTFEAPPAAVDALRAAGFDAVSMANNHGRDFGSEGLEDSLAIKDAQADNFIIGIGRDDTAAYAPFTATVRGQRIAVIAATQVIDEELVGSWTATATNPGLASAKRADALVAAVQRARAAVDTVVVFLHWGVELEGCPTGAQRTLARQLVDAGADIVVGSHAHRLLGGGMLDNAFVGYGLGNFDFASRSAETQRTGVLRVTVTGRHIDKYEFVPGVVDGSVATPLEGDAAAGALDYWNGLRACTGLAA